MLSKHPERCRFPHGHTRRIEVVVSADSLDDHDMVVDFKALSLACGAHIDRLDHAMAVNAADPLREEIERVYPGSTVVFDDSDPTTEVLARDIFDFLDRVLADGFKGLSDSGVPYTIPAGKVSLERVRVWETPTSWAEYRR